MRRRTPGVDSRGIAPGEISGDGTFTRNQDDLTTTRLTLRQWLQALERVEVLKPGATTRIMASPKLARIALPKP